MQQGNRFVSVREWNRGVLRCERVTSERVASAVVALVRLSRAGSAAVCGCQVSRASAYRRVMA